NLHKLIFRYNRYDRDATAILIWHGTNDWFYGVSVDEFKRNFQDIYSRLKQECPIANFLFLTPIFRFETARGNHEPGDGFETQNLSGNTLLDFENAVIDLAETYKVDFVNMRLETKFTIANVNDFYEDKVHPNERGYEVISKIIIEKLRKI
ncbi:MAG: hypothetical protein JXR38_02475, partial [Bacilli bacterium]|nr:hypothetical protein [Bacilli bacterium]